MSYLAILAAGIFFTVIAVISLCMFLKGFGKGYLLLTLTTILLIYFIFDLSGPILDSYRPNLFTN